jgi:SEC-C motif-containing protein
MAACPCGSALEFTQCCRPYLRGDQDAPTAEALMRSRYTAYVRRDTGYLLRTWHPSTRPALLEMDDGTWLGLDVLATSKGRASDATGTVSFAAHFALDDSSTHTMREDSRFVRDEGRWLYVDGDLH